MSSARLRSTVASIAAAALVVLLLLAPSPPAQQKSDCDQKPAKDYAGEPVQVDLPDAASLEHDIGRKRSGEDSDEVVIKTRDDVQLPAKGTSLSGEPVGGFSAVKDEGRGRIRKGQISVGVATSGGNRIIVTSCIVRKGVEPGRYAGTVLVHGGEIGQIEIPATATVQASSWAFWLLLALAAGALGFALRTVANLAQLAEQPSTAGGRRRRDLALSKLWPLYRRDKVIFAASIVLTVIAVLVAWYSAYWTNETFGAANLADWGKLAGAALVAATGGTTLADLAGALKYKPDKPPG